MMDKKLNPMEFKSLKNIDTAFRQVRSFCIVFLCCCTVVTVCSVIKAFSFAEAQRRKVYVLENGKSLLLALSQDAAQNRPAEAREHVRRFHELFFTLSPDADAIESNVRRALNMADGSAVAYYQTLAEKGYFNRLIAANVTQTVSIDSMACDFDTYPFTVRTFGRQRIIRESNITERSLVTSCRLRDAVRSDGNPQGFLIEDFLVNENKDLETYER